MTELELLQALADRLQMIMEILSVSLGLMIAIIVAVTWRG